MHTHIDQGVNFRKLANKYQNSKVGEMTFGALWLHSGPLCVGANVEQARITRRAQDGSYHMQSSLPSSSRPAWIDNFKKTFD